MHQEAEILLIDDDCDLSLIIIDMLEDYGYKVEHAASSEDGFDLLAEKNYDLLILDINLPDMTGFELCQAIRKLSEVPIIFASARTDESDRIKGFDIGGDDYLPKPYSMQELLSRVNALLRRTYGFKDADEKLSFVDLVLDPVSRSLTKAGRPIALSLREFDLLKYLAQNKNKAVAKEELLAEVWGPFNAVEPSTLTVHIRWLREKIEDDPKKPEYIKTVYKVGYILED